tara:strand:+ start:514 stop:630 length:117 start_codon:yes stop_codon:yes gene_type:complete
MIPVPLWVFSSVGLERYLDRVNLSTYQHPKSLKNPLKH